MTGPWWDRDCSVIDCAGHRGAVTNQSRTSHGPVTDQSLVTAINERRDRQGVVTAIEEGRDRRGGGRDRREGS